MHNACGEHKHIAAVGHKVVFVRRVWYITCCDILKMWYFDSDVMVDS